MTSKQSYLQRYFDLSEKEEKAYLTLATEGIAMTVSEVAAYTGLTRTTLNDVLEHLTQRKFVEKCSESKVKRYLVSSVHDLYLHIRAGELKLQHAKAELEAFISSISSVARTALTTSSTYTVKGNAEVERDLLQTYNEAFDHDVIYLEIHHRSLPHISSLLQGVSEHITSKSLEIRVLLYGSQEPLSMQTRLLKAKSLQSETPLLQQSQVTTRSIQYFYSHVEPELTFEPSQALSSLYHRSLDTIWNTISLP